MKTQTKAKHTEGEWKIMVNSFGTLRITNYSGQTSIAELLGHDTDEANEANAKLIAAAPDLLSSLMEAQKFLIEKINATPTSVVRNKMCDLNITIESAIQKATT